MAFPVRPLSVVDSCARALARAIVRRELRAGQRLPPERALASQFRVNRTTLREALGRLINARIVSVRHGSGYVVRNIEAHGGPDLLPTIFEVAAERGELVPVVRDLLLVRRHLSRAVLERLADPSSAADSAPIVTAVDAYEQMAAAGALPEELAEAEGAILAAIAKATGSLVLQVCLNPVAHVIRELSTSRGMFSPPDQVAARYRALIAWLKDPDPVAIDVIMDALARSDATTVERASGAD